MKSTIFWFILGCFGFYAPPVTAQDLTFDDISLDDLLSVEISTASRHKQSTREAPASVTVITSEEISRFGYQNLEDVFKSVRGFYVSNDRNYGYLGVRGFSRPTDYNNRILLLLNGQTLSENIWGGFGLNGDTPVPLEALDRIEIVRGPGSALYGTYAMFAVINLITKTETSTDKNNISWTQGRFGHKTASLTTSNTFDTGASLFVSGSWGDINGQNQYYPDFDAPETNNGVAEDLDWEKYYGALITATYSNFTLQAYYNKRKKGIPTGAWEVDFNDPNSVTKDEYREIRLSYKKEISPATQITLDGTLNGYYYDGGYPYDGVLGIETGTGNWATTAAQTQWDIHPKLRLIAGIEYQNHFKVDYLYQDPADVYTDIRESNHLFSTYVQGEYQLTPSISLTGGLRYDRYNARLHPTSPRGALITHLNQNTTLKLLYGAAFRAPNVYERFIDDPFSAYKPNPNLDIEKIRTIEAVWEQRFNPNLSGVVSTYQYKMDDLIDQVIDPADDFLQYQNTSSVNAWGIELEIQAKREDGLLAYANYAFQRTRDKQTNQTLSNSPEHLFKAGLTFFLATDLSLAGEIQYETARKTIYNTQTDAYMLSDITLRAQESAPILQALPGHWHFQAQIKNLFDTSYATPGGFEHVQPAIQQNGRSYFLKLGYSF